MPGQLANPSPARHTTIKDPTLTKQDNPLNPLTRRSTPSSSTHNPFKLPTGGEWLSLRRNYTLELSEQRANERTQDDISKKRTFKTRHTGNALPRMRKLLKNYDKEAVDEIKNNSTNMDQA